MQLQHVQLIKTDHVTWIVLSSQEQRPCLVSDSYYAMVNATICLLMMVLNDPSAATQSCILLPCTIQYIIVLYCTVYSTAQ